MTDIIAEDLETPRQGNKIRSTATIKSGLRIGQTLHHKEVIIDHRSLVIGHWSLVIGHWRMADGGWRMACVQWLRVARLVAS